MVMEDEMKDLQDETEDKEREAEKHMAKINYWAPFKG